MDSRGGYVSKILCVKTKEFGPLGGGEGACAGHVPSRSANGVIQLIHCIVLWIQHENYVGKLKMKHKYDSRRSLNL